MLYAIPCAIAVGALLAVQQESERLDALLAALSPDERAAALAEKKRQDKEREQERRHRELCESIKEAGSRASFWSLFRSER